MQTCPVCGKAADEAAPFSAHGGKVYYFACPACKVRFDEDPERYLSTGPRPHEHHHGGHNQAA